MSNGSRVKLEDILHQIAFRELPCVSVSSNDWIMFMLSASGGVLNWQNKMKTH